MLVAPICFLYHSVEEAFFVFRNFYTRFVKCLCNAIQSLTQFCCYKLRHFCKLHTISSHPESIVSLCKMFEDLLQERDPQLFYHLLHMKVNPLSIAFHWIFHAFAGYLNVEQLLVLWDRILAYNSLTILSVLSASIFLFRSKFLMSASTPQEIFVRYEH